MGVVSLNLNYVIKQNVRFFCGLVKPPHHERAEQVINNAGSLADAKVASTVSAAARLDVPVVSAAETALEELLAEAGSREDFARVTIW